MIQQRTVRHLRAAIRPDSSPQIYLPDRFRDDTTELADGTIVMLDEYNRPVRLKSGRISLGKGPEVPEVVVGGALAEGQEAVEIQVQETLPEALAAQDDQKVMVAEEYIPAERGEEERDAQQEASEQQQEQTPQAEEVTEAQGQPQVSPWEVRGENPPREEPAKDAAEETQKPISRAERRRLIKEEIQRLSQGETPIYYQRRLW